MGLLDALFGKKTDFKALADAGASIIDVRTPAEFKSGNIPSSKNIPLDQISKKVAQLKKLNKPVLLCCASGMRSGNAARILKSNGIEAYNGGPWHKLQRKI